MSEPVQLQSGPASVELLPSRGCNISNWRAFGRDIFYVDQSSLASPSIKYKGGNPIMFPIFSTLRLDGEGHLLYDGRHICLEQHGIARISPHWTPLSVDKSTARFQLKSCDSTRKIFPFDFELDLSVELQPDALVFEQKVFNPSTRDELPFSAGFHPYFKVSDPANCEISGIPVGTSYDMRLNSGETALGQHYCGRLPLGIQEINHHFVGPMRTLRLRDRLTGHDVTIRVSNDYRCLTVWSLPGEPFVCVEPNTGRRGALENRENLLHLQPGQSWKGQVRFELSSS